MEYVLKDLQPKKVFKYFEELTRIPRCSGNEKQVSDYLVNFAKERSLEVIQDKCLNVIIKKPGTKGYENAPVVILQGHMDMVCEKFSNVQHDFSKDPIPLVVEGDFIKTKGTTLGADNGIAVAMAMAILDSKDISHPPLEVVLTVDEETGMGGALNIEPKNINGQMLINIDSEEEGKFLTSCAGGIDSVIKLPIKWTNPPENYSAYSIKITGLLGGHSGVEIDKSRANANKLMGRLLNALNKKIDFCISNLEGGAKVNAITREAEATVLVNGKDIDGFNEIIEEYKSIFKNEYNKSDPNIEIEVNSIEKPDKIFTNEIKEKAINLLMLIPNGVHNMSVDIEGLVETSSNLGVVTTDSENIAFNTSIRSSVRSRRYLIQNRIEALANILDVDNTFKSEYPEWEFNPNSKLREICVKSYEKLYGKKPEITAIHAGLECGVFKERLGDIDMISLGPDMKNVHTPEEALSISSTERTYNLLIEILKNIK